MADPEPAMFANQALTLKGAVRLCALGPLAVQSMTYRELATGLRRFVDRAIGPAPDARAVSVELMCCEGLVERVGDEGEDALLCLTADGRELLRILLVAPLSPINSELNRLLVALKIRFLHLLEATDRIQQIDLLIEEEIRELARAQELRDDEADSHSFAAGWFDLEIAATRNRLAWLVGLRKQIGEED